MSARFTIDGGAALEAHLAWVCGRVAEDVRELLPEHRLEGLVLGGGYGRGQGGVFVRQGEQLPYNDMDFYVFVRGGRFLNERRYGAELDRVGERLSGPAGVHIEFKIETLARFRQSTVSMFSYDLVSGHRVILGGDDLFEACGSHFCAEAIPVSEATRLLVNRCTGLLLARELLARDHITSDDVDFASRNIAKARLALGDALLASLRQYHWSCLERHARLRRLDGSEVSDLSCLNQVHSEHAAGVEFKLHPNIPPLSRACLEAEHAAVSALAEQVWLWVEGRRLNRRFASARQYSEYGDSKCDEGPGWRNYLLNCRTFGLRGALNPRAHRYPRERLLNSLPLLLWNSEAATRPPLQRHLQKQLHTDAEDWSGLVGAYKSVWPVYG